jgi:hypothetical protein
MSAEKTFLEDSWGHRKDRQLSAHGHGVGEVPRGSR